MKVVTAASRILLGLMFLVFGLNGFLHFIPQQPIASPLAAQYLTALSLSHYMVLVFLIQIIAGALLLSNRFVPLALTLLAPVIVNILLFHTLMAPASIAPAILATIFWATLFVSARSAFAPLFQARVAAAPDTIPALQQPHSLANRTEAFHA